MLKDHLQQITNGINYSQTHENVILIGYFNGEISDTIVGSFCAIDKLKSLIKENRTCIGLILINFPEDFKTSILEIRLSDFHKMILTVRFHINSLSSMIYYWNYTFFDKHEFEKEIKNTL